MPEPESVIEEKQIEPILVAGFRMRGTYAEIGTGFSKIGSAMGFNIKGHALALFYDGEYKENDADFEACMPLKKMKEAKDLKVRELPGGRAFTLVHRGPYQDLRASYDKLRGHIKNLGLEPKRPSREIYVKGPGMIFKGNPEKYITEIQMFVELRE